MSAERDPHPGWHVLWTRSHCERLLHDQLAARGFEAFLPEISVWSRGGAARRTARRPMFPGYVFLHHAMDKSSYLEIRKARGLVEILGERWDRPAVVPDRDIESLRAVSQSGASCLPVPYLREGMRVRIVRGALQDIEGILTRCRQDKGLLVLSVDLLQRSVAVEVDCTAVVPA